MNQKDTASTSFVQSWRSARPKPKGEHREHDEEHDGKAADGQETLLWVAESLVFPFTCSQLSKPWRRWKRKLRRQRQRWKSKAEKAFASVLGQYDGKLKAAFAEMKAQSR